MIYTVKSGITVKIKNFFRCIYEVGDERSVADGAENEARSAYDTIDGDSPASNPRPSGKNRAGA
jgi:hypothetical protein